MLRKRNQLYEFNRIEVVLCMQRQATKFHTNNYIIGPKSNWKATGKLSFRPSSWPT